MEERLSKKVSVLFNRTTDQKLNEISQRTERPKSNLIRWVVQDWVEKVFENK
jgi:predicted DNA-binding protein